MKQVFISRAGGPEVLEVRESAAPTPGTGEVCIEVAAAGVNFADTLARKGLYPDAPPLPCVVGYEVAGTVSAVGAGVDASLAGRRVLAMTRFNGYSEQVVVPANQVFDLPEALDFNTGASLPVVYMTAWQLLVVMGSLKPGERILIHNAGGGVGLAALDIARHIGAETIGTASTRKHAALKERGLDHAIDYTQGDWQAAVRDLTGGRGVDLVIDPLGGEHWKRSYAALRSAGRLGMFGVSTASEGKLGSKVRLLKTAVQMPIFHPIGLMNVNRAVFGVNMGHMWHESDLLRGWMEQVLDGIRDGWVRPHVDATFPFARAGEAHAFLEDRKNFGKVVLTP